REARSCTFHRFNVQADHNPPAFALEPTSMDYHSVSCNRGVPIVSRGGYAAYDLNPSRRVDPERLAAKKACFAKRHRVASTRSESRSRESRDWSSAEPSQTSHVRASSPMACPVLMPSPFSII
ncbi:uncharacterized protein METZ01_LOCUS344508, partial [marine metagenome]